MSNQRINSPSRADRNRFVSRLSRAWAWTKRHLLRSQPTRDLEYVTSVPSVISSHMSSWDEPTPLDQPSVISDGNRQVTSRRQLVPRQRFYDRKLDQEHFIRVTRALIDEMKKTQERRHAIEPHMPEDDASKSMGNH